MSILEIILYPDLRLKTIATPIDSITPEIKQIARNMCDTLLHLDGIIGLAAPQMGILKRMIVFDLSEKKDRVQILINPEITFSSTKTNRQREGSPCLPGISAMIERPEHIQVTALTLEGHSVTLNTQGLLATCIQHEIDHLNGIVFINHLSELKQKRLLEKLRKNKRQAALANKKRLMPELRHA